MATASTAHLDQLRRPALALACALGVMVAVLVGTPGAAADGASGPPDLVPTCDGVPDAGFPDTGRAGVHATAIDCLAGYGLTVGTGDGRFEPNRTVRRWQMALFLTRLAAIADDQVDAFDLPAPGGTAFTDLGPLSDEARDAVSVLAQLGITRGTTATTFDPLADVSRGQMAAFVNRLQGAIQAALGGDPDGFTPAGDAFDDDDGTTHERDINAIAAVGITTGTTDRVYAPGEPLQRDEMASLLVRHIGVNVNAGTLVSAFPPRADAPGRDLVAQSFVRAIVEGDRDAALAWASGHVVDLVLARLGGIDVTAGDGRVTPRGGVLEAQFDAGRLDTAFDRDGAPSRFFECTVAVGLVRSCTQTPARVDGIRVTGEPVDLFFRAGATLAVVGVPTGDVATIHEIPGPGTRVLASAGPLADDLLATGATRALPDSFWTQVDVGDALGWIDTGRIAFIGPTRDVTADVIDELGERPTAPTLVELGRLVAESQASEDPPSRVVLVQTPSTGDVPDVVYDVVGLGDDAVRGVRLRVFGRAAPAGIQLRTVEQTDLCARGGSPTELCV